MDVLTLASLQKKYKKMSEIENKVAKLSYSEPVLREKLAEMRDQNRALYEAIEGMSEKYMQYAELLTPLLETNQVTRNLLGAWL